MTSSTFEAHIHLSSVEHQRATRFLSTSAWIAVLGLTVIAAGVWIVPFARAAGHRDLVSTVRYVNDATIIGLFVLLALLQRRLGAQIRRAGAQHDLLIEQNEQLIAENETSRAAACRLHQMTRHLEAAQTAARVGSWEIDLATGARFWSPEMYRVWGIQVGAEVPGVDEIIDAVHPDDHERFRLAVRRSMADGSPFVEQVRLVSAAGATRVIEAQGCRVPGDDGSEMMIGTVQDVTARVELESQFRQAQKMEAVGQLAGGVAHDFNNVLTVVEGYAHLLEAADISTRDREAVGEILEASQRAAALTRQLLGFSRRQVYEPRVVNVNTTVSGVRKLLHRLIGENIEVVTRLDGALAPVMVDPGQLEQVIVNLAVNARDAMPHGGVLILETANVALDAPTVDGTRPARPHSHVMISVVDTGTGIDPAVVDRIFEPFFTTKENGKGTGLGLAMVQGIVEKAGGQCRVESHPGRGTTFRIYLPIHGGDPETTRPPGPTTASLPRGRGTLLLVEDDESLRTMACMTLRRYGYRVLEAPDGFTALQICGDRRASFDLLITDLVLPGMDGREIARAVECLRPGTPALIVSGYTNERPTPGLDEPGVSFLGKPFTPDELHGAVSRALAAATEC